MPIGSGPTRSARSGTLTIYGASDYAVTEDGGDYTVHIVVGIDPEWRMYVLDLWREQTSADQWIEAFCDLVLEWKPLGWAEEKGQIKAGVGPFLRGECATQSLCQRGHSSRPGATRRSGRNPFVGGWRSTASMCRYEHRGTPISAPSS